MGDQRGSGPVSASLRAPFGVREFRALWLAETLSIAGDQLARVALAVLVFGRTGSAALTGITYALTFVPSFIGGVLLGGLGDRYARRTVLVTADVGRAVLIGAAALPGCPLWLVGVLVALMTLLGGPFRGAQQAVLPDVLSGRTYVSGMAVRNITIQAAQLAGFAGGGALIAGSDSAFGLGLDAITFVASAVVLRFGIGLHKVPAQPRASFWSSTVTGARQVFGSAELRDLLTLCWLAGFYVVPEALAAPYAGELGGGAVAVGLLMASDPAGSVLGGIIFGKWMSADSALTRLAFLGVAAGLPLSACLARPPLPVSMLLFAVSGIFATGYNIHATARFVQLLPVEARAQGSGLLTSGLVAVQGVGALLAGIVADQIPTAVTVGIFGVAGALTACTVLRSGTRIAHGRVGRAPAPMIDQ